MVVSSASHYQHCTLILTQEPHNFNSTKFDKNYYVFLPLCHSQHSILYDFLLLNDIETLRASVLLLASYNNIYISLIDWL